MDPASQPPTLTLGRPGKAALEPSEGGQGSDSTGMSMGWKSAWDLDSEQNHFLDWKGMRLKPNRTGLL